MDGKLCFLKRDNKKSVLFNLALPYTDNVSIFLIDISFWGDFRFQYSILEPI